MPNYTLAATLATALVMSSHVGAQVPAAEPVARSAALPGYVAVMVSPADAYASGAVAPIMPSVRIPHRWSDSLPVSLGPALIRVARWNSGVGLRSDTVEPIDYAAGLTVTVLALDLSLRLVAMSPGPVRLRLSAARSF